jgi:hypothetical protein
MLGFSKGSRTEHQVDAPGAEGIDQQFLIALFRHLGAKRRAVDGVPTERAMS